MRKRLFFLIALILFPASVYAGFHLGVVDAVKKKVEELDEKLTKEEIKQVKELYAALESSIENEDIDAFGSCFANDYLHQQATKADWIEYASWIFTDNTNIEVSITDLKVMIEDNLATTSFHLKMGSKEWGVWIDEDVLANPYGSWNYLIKENGEWKFYGDHTQPVYYVYGGNTLLSPVQVMNPEIYGYTLLGSGRPSETKTFYGSFNFFEIVVYWNNVMNIDALQKSDGSYYSSTVHALTVTDEGNLFGAPDGLYTTVGAWKMSIGGVVVSSDGSDSIRVIVGQ